MPSATSASRLPIRLATIAMRRFRAPAMASGSTSWPISRAISASPGSWRIWARKAGSSAIVLGDLGQRLGEGGVESGLAAGSGPPAVSAISVAIAICCDARQRLKSSASVRSRKRRSLSTRPVVSLTGAEKPRSSDGTGGADTPSKTIVCSRFGEMDDVVLDAAAGCGGEGEVGAVRADEAEADGNVHRALGLLAGRRRAATASATANRSAAWRRSGPRRSIFGRARPANTRA